MTAAPILRATHVRRAPDDAFRLFTDHIGAWWPLTSHSVLDGRAVSVAFVDGRIVERTVDGAEQVWGTVLTWEPPDRLVVSWHPGRPATQATEVEIRFLGDEHGTRVEVEHRGWERLGDAADALRHGYSGPSAWGYVLDHFAHTADVPAERAAALRAAYTAFYAEARGGGFGDPPAGEWTAPQVVAHIALTDAELAAVCRLLIARKPAAFDNGAVQDPGNLDRFVDGRPIDAVIVDAERASEDLVLLVNRLDDDQLPTSVPCHLTDDDPGALAAPAARRHPAAVPQPGPHPPLHTAQLADLRPGHPTS